MPDPTCPLTPDAYMQRLRDVPLMGQPGERWLYTVGSNVLGVLVARAAGKPLDVVFQEWILGPLGMSDTGFWIPRALMPLKNSETVEILTAPAARPSRDWLAHVRTGRARSKIRQWLRHEEQETSQKLGREILDREVKRVVITKINDESEDVVELKKQTVYVHTSASDSGSRGLDSAASARRSSSVSATSPLRDRCPRSISASNAPFFMPPHFILTTVWTSCRGNDRASLRGTSSSKRNLQTCA